jgi:hypothetical protein
VPDWTRQSRICVSAVVAQLRIPAGLLSGLSTADSLEIEPEGGELLVSFKAEGTTIAVGKLSDTNGRLSATIIWTGAQRHQSKFDQWRFRRQVTGTPQPAADSSSPPSGKDEIGSA